MSNSPVTRERIVFRQLSLATAFVFAEAALSSLTDVKLGPFQLAEIMGMVMLPFAFWDISRWREQRPGRLVGWHPWLFALSVAVMVVGAVAAYHREAFVIPVDATSFAKQPGWISFSRLVQFLLAFTTAYAMVKVCSRWPGVLRQTLVIYAAVVALSSAYGLLSFAAFRFAGIDLGGAYENPEGYRLKSFFVEGGPFGMYALSGLLVQFLLLRRNFASRRFLAIAAGLTLFAFLLAQSKSATLAGVVVFVLSAAATSGSVLKKHWKLVAVFAVFVAASAAMTGSADVFSRILERRDELTAAPELFGDDPNILMGRIAGAVIVPEMIARHPLIGVGIGNYSLLRDSGLYNPVLPAVDAWDLHGLGAYGLTAEIGLLGLLSLMAFLLTPVLAARRLANSLDLTALAFFPFVALVFGVQPTFLYPWAIYALAVASLQPANQSA